MKRTILIYSLTLALIVGVFYACKKEKVITNPSANQNSQFVGMQSESSDMSGNGGGTIEEMKKNLTLIAMGLLDLSRDRDFVNQVNTEAAQERDGDWDVIIIPPSLQKPENRPPLCWDNREDDGIFTPLIVEEMRKSIVNNGGTPQEAAGLSKILFTFKLQEANMYPQIFIPFLDEVDLNKSPMVALNFGEDADTLDGWKLDNGSFQKISITEDMAKETPVWVVGMNERVCDDGDFPPPQFLYENPFVCGNCRCEPSVGETYENCNDCPRNPSLCGNGTCESASGESFCTCREDCPKVGGGGGGGTGKKTDCGDGNCDSDIGEDQNSCPIDCCSPKVAPNYYECMQSPRFTQIQVKGKFCLNEKWGSGMAEVFFVAQIYKGPGTGGAKKLDGAWKRIMDIKRKDAKNYTTYAINVPVVDHWSQDYQYLHLTVFERDPAGEREYDYSQHCDCSNEYKSHQGKKYWSWGSTYYVGYNEPGSGYSHIYWDKIYYDGYQDINASCIYLQISK